MHGRNNCHEKEDKSEASKIHRAIDLETKIRKIEGIIQGKASRGELDSLEEEFAEFVHSDNQGNVAAYAESFYAETGAIAISSSNPFPLSSSFFSFNVNQDSIYQYVTANADYSIFYSITYTGDVGAKIAIAVNDIITPESIRKLVCAPGTITGQIIKTLTSGDKISLINISTSETITLDTSAGFPLSLVVIQLGRTII